MIGEPTYIWAGSMTWNVEHQVYLLFLKFFGLLSTWYIADCISLLELFPGSIRNSTALAELWDKIHILSDNVSNLKHLLRNAEYSPTLTSSLLQMVF